MSDMVISEGYTDFAFKEPVRSDWRCQLFGSGTEGITYHPAEGDVPNWFWRKMQYLCFGHKWERVID